MAAEHTVDDHAPRTGRRRLNPAIGVRLLHGALWSVVLAAPLVAALAITQVATLRHQITQAPTPVLPPPETASIEGLAQLAIADFLTNTTGASSRPANAADQGWVVESTTSLGAEEVSPGYFAVTVAAWVAPLDSGDEGFGDASPTTTPSPRILVFAVGIAETDAGWIATGPPSLIASPSIAVSSTDRRGDRLEATPGLEATLDRFLAALLTGDGELDRYTAPDVSIAPVTPAPFAAVDVVEAVSLRRPDDARQVTAIVTGTDVSGRSMTLSYALVATEREGRWEVTDLLAALPLPRTVAMDISIEGGSS